MNLTCDEAAQAAFRLLVGRPGASNLEMRQKHDGWVVSAYRDDKLEFEVKAADTGTTVTTWLSTRSSTGGPGTSYNLGLRPATTEDEVARAVEAGFKAYPTELKRAYGIPTWQ